MVIKCEAVVSGDGFYYSGQTVVGRICLSLDERILVKAIALKISGFAQSEWDIAKKKTDKPNLVKGREDYIATTTYFVGSEEATSKMMPAGSYTFAFNCTIPEKSPSSYESSSGFIRYQLKVIVDYGDRADEVFTETLCVIRAYDLRPQGLVLKLPLDMEVYESKCCCEYWKTPIILYVNLPQAGYVPGETISVYARLLNEGRVPLKHLLVSLNQVVTYTSVVPRLVTKTDRYNIVQVMIGLTNKEPLREVLERLPIPTLPPTCDTDCKVLQLSYEVEASVVQVKGDAGVVVRIPVLIGTTPFDNDDYPTYEKESQINDTESVVPSNSITSVPVISSKSFDTQKDVLPTAPVLSSNSIEVHTGNVPTDIVNSAPPGSSSYQEATFMSTANFSKEEKHSLNKDTSGFKPKYLYYEINEDIEMTPNTMEMTKEITISSSYPKV